MRPILILLPLLSLAACATPYERCLREASEELRTVDMLIVEQEEIVRRGYKIETELSPRSRVQFCAGSGGNVSIRLCNSDRLRTVERPVAVDVDFEARKLASLRERRDALATSTAQKQAMCPAPQP